MARPATSATERPAPSDPVSVTARTRSSSISLGHMLRRDEQRLERTGRESRPPEHVLDQQRRLGHVRRMLQQTDVARHEARRREAHHLPHGEVPGHDGQHRAPWARSAHGSRWRRCSTSSSASRLSACSANQRRAARALGHLALGRREGLAHLGGEDPGDVGELALEQLRGRRRQVRPLLERRPAVEGEGALGGGELGLHLLFGIGLEDLLGLARGGIDGGDRHGKIIAHRPGAAHRPDRGPPRARDGANAGSVLGDGADRARPRAPGRSRRRSLPVGVWGSSPTRKYDLGRL